MFATVGRRTRRSRLLLTAVSVLIAGTCGAMGGIGARAAMGREVAAAAPAPFADVDPALLRGTTLTVPEANFSVTPAGTGWSWKTRQAAAPVAGQGQDRFFLCVPAAGGTVLMVIVSSPPGVDRLDTRFMEGAKRAPWRRRQTA